MKKLIIPLIIVFGVGINTNAQEKANIEIKENKNSLINSNEKVLEKSNKELNGDKFSFNYSYDKAINKYSRSKQLTVEGQRMLAVSYHNMNQNVESEAAYSTLISMPAIILPEDYYNYAMVLKINCKYDESNKWMDKFEELKPNDLRVKSYNDNKEEFSNLLKDDGKYKIEHLNINTIADDFGASFYKNEIVFSSTRSKPKMILRKYNWTGKPFWDMYVSEVNEGQLEKPKKFDRSLNGKLHDGPVSFSNDGSYMAFTRNDYDTKRKDKVVELQIWFSSFKDGKWSKPESFILNNKEYSVGQPCLTSNGKTMYFTSDMPGGFGGADIYKITKDDKGVWGKAENMGDKINTEGDEMFPFFEETNGILFFSSNGRFGLGGLDIFICPINGLQFGKVYNAGFPLNTKDDDFAAIVDDKLNKGYFSSNRSGGNGGDDIYSVDINRLDIGKKIQGIAKNKDGNPIPNTFITLRDDKTNVIDTITTKNDAAYTFLVESNKNFKLIGDKQAYIEGDTVANTFGKEYIVKADVILLQKEVIVEQKTVAQKIEVNTDLGKILGLNSIYFDLDKYNIRPDAQTELDKIVKTMNENPDMIVELSGYTDCRASKGYNQILSDKRAKASANYIKTRITKPGRISGKGYGETKLVNDCACEGTVVSSCSDEEFQKDRRTEFIIVKK